MYHFGNSRIIVSMTEQNETCGKCVLSRSFNDYWCKSDVHKEILYWKHSHALSTNDKKLTAR